MLNGGGSGFVSSYTSHAVTLIWSVKLSITRKDRQTHIIIQPGRNNPIIKHPLIHTRHNCKVLLSIIFRIHDNTVSLGSCNKQLLNFIRLRVHPINFNDGHLMLIKLDVLCCECSHVDNAEEIGTVGFDGEMYVLCFVDEGRVGDGFGSAV